MQWSKHLCIFYCFTAFLVGTCVRMYHIRTVSDCYLLYNGSACTWKKNISFEEKVNLIAVKAGVWKNPTALFHSKDFAVMYRYPKTYQKHVIKLVANPKVSLAHKKIALYGMEQLDLVSYLSLAEDCYQLYSQGMLPYPLFQIAIGYCLAGDHPIVKHYQDECVQQFLRAITQCDLTIEFQQHIEMIQTGVMWKNWQREQVGANFKWEKKPLPFVSTIVDIIAQSNYYKHHLCLEGHIGGSDFMMLYEHPEYYIEDAHQLLCNPWPDPYEGGKYTLNGIRNEVVFNAMRKLDEKDFMLLFKQQNDVGLYTNLIGGIGGSYYDTLLLKPYSFPSKLHYSLSLSPKAQRDVNHYQDRQAEQARLRKLYDISSYDHNKPFYCFDPTFRA